MKTAAELEAARLAAAAHEEAMVAEFGQWSIEAALADKAYKAAHRAAMIAQGWMNRPYGYVDP